jgi:hypothetical protein
MTIQKRSLISLQDLLGVEYECTHCHARYSIPLDKLDRVTLSCPNCKEQWFDHPARTSINVSEDMLHNFVGQLRALQSCQLKGVAVRLEIADGDDHG